VAAIASARPDILLVALGSPAQERFISSHREELQATAALGVGGTLDVLAGRARRAPSWICRLGLEWLYRILRQPTRLKRALAIPRFVLAVLSESAGAGRRRSG
jgi:N-acetylglucosaminyldiphosphoundecaprenol N-acetyl-beta-D-mannosaminyltransferase